MTTIPFSGTNRTITTETSQVGDNNFINNLLFRRNSSASLNSLEEVIDINQDLELYNNNQLNLLNPRTLYRTGIFSFNTQLFRINREEEVLVTTQARNLKIVSQETIKKIIDSKKKLAHLGLIVIGIKGLARKKLGTKTLITILDKRWSDGKKAMIAAIEVDMNNNKGIFYCSPDFILSIKDLKYIEIGLQTKGYEEFIGQSNLLINIGFIGKLTDNSTTKYKLDITNIIEAMSSKGIKMIKPMEIDSALLSGLDWNLNKNLEDSNNLIPEEQVMFKNSDNSYSIRFSDYKNKNIPEEILES